MNNTAWTKEEVIKEAARIRESVRNTFNELAGLRAITYLYATRNPETGETGKGIVLLPAQGKFETEDREFYARMLRVAGEECRAMGIVFASEIWSIDPAYVEAIGFAAAQAEFSKSGASLHDHPHRIEGVWVNLEHHRLTGHLTWFARITRDADGKPTLGEWVEEHWETNRGSGRFLHMLPQVN